MALATNYYKKILSDMHGVFVEWEDELTKGKNTTGTEKRQSAAMAEKITEVFSPDAFVEGEDDQGCGGDRGDGSGIEGDVLEGLEVLDQGVGPLGGSPH